MQDVVKRAITRAVLESLEARRLLAADDYFAIRAVDAETGRGVPQVDFVMTDGTRYTSDNAGYVAFGRAGHLDADHVFAVESYGYRPAEPTFAGGNRVALHPTLGGSVVVPLDRTMIAERLYRQTGQNAYDETLKLGLPAPVQYPLTDNADVNGQDTVQTAIYKGKLYWFYGDTFWDNDNDNTGGFFGNGADGGNFRTTVAVSELPANGGLDPDVGTDRTYIVNQHGDPKQVFPQNKFSAASLYWLGTPFVVEDANGEEVMVASYTALNGLDSAVENGFARWNDALQEFDSVNTHPIGSPINPTGSPTRVTFGDTEYFVMDEGVALVRVPATYSAVTEIGQYETYTPFATGTNWNNANSVPRSAVVRDGSGEPVWAWRNGVKPMSALDQETFINRGLWGWDQTPFVFENADNPGEHITFSTSSLAWNEYQQAWTLVGQEIWGDSFLGEVWYAESRSLTGPWATTRKVATHADAKDPYTFYNLWQHPYFSADSRYLYFEGTNTDFLEEGGLRGEYFDNNDLTGYAFSWIDNNVNFDWGAGSPEAGIHAETFSVRWTGRLQTVGESGDYSFRIRADDGVRLWVNGQLLIDQWNAGRETHVGSVRLDADATVDIRMEYRENYGDARAILEWATPSNPGSYRVVPGGRLSHEPLVLDDNYNQFMYRLDLADPRVRLRAELSFDFETGHVLDLVVNHPAATAQGLSILDLATGQPVATPIERVQPPAGVTARWELADLLPDGLYRAVLPAAGVAAPGSAPLAEDVVLDFHVLTGDADRDRRVGLGDFLVLRSNFGAAGKTFSEGDFDYDGDVDLADFLVLRGNFGASLTPPLIKSLFADGDGDRE